MNVRLKAMVNRIIFLPQVDVRVHEALTKAYVRSVFNTCAYTTFQLHPEFNLGNSYTWRSELNAQCIQAKSNDRNDKLAYGGVFITA